VGLQVDDGATRVLEPKGEGVHAMNEGTTASDQLLTPDEVSEILGGVPPATLKRWRTQRTGPVVLHIGRHVRYRRSAVEAWLQTKDREAAEWMAS
jgi:predicted DNA-binding transcriptional regulator AlpA